MSLSRYAICVRCQFLGVQLPLLVMAGTFYGIGNHLPYLLMYNVHAM
jgi:hypothetical protein